MKRYKLKSIYLKFVAVFLGVLWLSSTSAFFISYNLVEDDLRSSLQQQLRDKANSIISFSSDYSLNLKELQGLISESNIKVQIFENIEALEASGLVNQRAWLEKIGGLKTGELIEGETENRGTLPYVVFRQKDEIIVLNINPHNSFVYIIKNIISTALLICVVLGSVLIAVAASMIVKPIKKLTAATKEVAKGNFDIRLETRSDDEVGQLTDHFNTMTQELKNIEYLRKDFISSVSHEFKTPMTAIQGFAKLIKDRSLDREQLEEYSDIIISETGRLANLSSNLLKLTDIENHSIHDKKTRFYVDEQIRRVILLLEDKWNEKKLDLDIELEQAEYCGDEELLQQVWINLISNAIKFSNIGGEIKISVKKENNSIRVEVADNGMGIAEEDKSRIFEKFYKGDRSRNTEGNGLGLAIAKKIVERSGGKITFESVLGKGTTFTTELRLL